MNFAQPFYFILNVGLIYFCEFHIGKDFQIKIKHFKYTDQYLVAFGLVSEVYFGGGLCKADKWFIFI